jgi:hypothetical protein
MHTRDMKAMLEYIRIRLEDCKTVDESKLVSCRPTMYKQSRASRLIVIICKHTPSVLRIRCVTEFSEVFLCEGARR